MTDRFIFGCQTCRDCCGRENLSRTEFSKGTILSFVIRFSQKADGSVKHLKHDEGSGEKLHPSNVQWLSDWPLISLALMNRTETGDSTTAPYLNGVPNQGVDRGRCTLILGYTSAVRGRSVSKKHYRY